MDDSTLRAIAAQVAAGLRRGSEEEPRARAALVGIGALIAREAPDDPVIREVLVGAGIVDEDDYEPVEVELEPGA